MKLVLATRNRHKIAEMRAILGDLSVELLSLEELAAIPEVAEAGGSLEENALEKARAVREATELSALADDSGLEVDALGGQPGVFSSRFAGEGATYEDNNRKLLSLLSGIPRERRTAKFRCVMALALSEEDKKRAAARAILGGFERWKRYSDGKKLDGFLTQGIVYGFITEVPRGESGFGYDPLFELPEEGRTFAEMSPEEKNERSHRYRALVEIRALLSRLAIEPEIDTL